MGKPSPSYGDRKQDEPDVRYEIATPFNPRANDAEILLFDNGDDVEIIVHGLPQPRTDYINYPDPSSSETNPDPTEEQIRENAVAQWIIKESLEILSAYNPETSDYKTRSGNRHLKDVHFTCERDQVNEAVLSAKEFLLTLEKKRFKQTKHFETQGRSPKRQLDQ